MAASRSRCPTVYCGMPARVTEHVREHRLDGEAHRRLQIRARHPNERLVVERHRGRIMRAADHHADQRAALQARGRRRCSSPRALRGWRCPRRAAPESRSRSSGVSSRARLVAEADDRQRRRRNLPKHARERRRRTRPPALRSIEALPASTTASASSERPSSRSTSHPAGAPVARGWTRRTTHASLHARAERPVERVHQIFDAAGERRQVPGRRAHRRS